eukprot:COSAG03_NODE_1466_length_4029_cov_15.580662_1_plen_104_part_00
MIKGHITDPVWFRNASRAGACTVATRRGMEFAFEANSHVCGMGRCSAGGKEMALRGLKVPRARPLFWRAGVSRRLARKKPQGLFQRELAGFAGIAIPWILRAG